SALGAAARARLRIDPRPVLWSVLGHAVALALLGLAVGDPATLAPRLVQPRMMMSLRVDPTESPSTPDAPSLAPAPPDSAATDSGSAFDHVPIREVDSVKLAVFRLRGRHSWANQ